MLVFLCSLLIAAAPIKGELLSGKYTKTVQLSERSKAPHTYDVFKQKVTFPAMPPKAEVTKNFYGMAKDQASIDRYVDSLSAAIQTMRANDPKHKLPWTGKSGRIGSYQVSNYANWNKGLLVEYSRQGNIFTAWFDTTDINKVNVPTLAFYEDFVRDGEAGKIFPPISRAPVSKPVFATSPQRTAVTTAPPRPDPRIAIQALVDLADTEHRERNATATAEANARREMSVQKLEFLEARQRRNQQWAEAQARAVLTTQRGLLLPQALEQARRGELQQDEGAVRGEVETSFNAQAEEIRRQALEAEKRRVAEVRLPPAVETAAAISLVDSVGSTAVDNSPVAGVQPDEEDATEKRRPVVKRRKPKAQQVEEAADGDTAEQRAVAPELEARAAPDVASPGALDDLFPTSMNITEMQSVTPPSAVTGNADVDDLFGPSDTFTTAASATEVPTGTILAADTVATTPDTTLDDLFAAPNAGEVVAQDDGLQAIKIQSAFRGYKARQEAGKRRTALRTQQSAATIQTFARSALAQQAKAELLKKAETAQKEREAEELQRKEREERDRGEQEAAAAMPAQTRTRTPQFGTAALRSPSAAVEERPVNAAKNIQRVFRGHQVRKEIGPKRAERLAQEKLDLSDQNMTDAQAVETLQRYEKLTNTKVINLSNNQLTDGIFPVLSAVLKNKVDLEVLDLAGNNFPEDKIVTLVSKLSTWTPKLKTLRIGTIDIQKDNGITVDDIRGAITELTRREEAADASPMAIPPLRLNQLPQREPEDQPDTSAASSVVLQTPRAKQWNISKADDIKGNGGDQRKNLLILNIKTTGANEAENNKIIAEILKVLRSNLKQFSSLKTVKLNENTTLIKAEGDGVISERQIEAKINELNPSIFKKVKRLSPFHTQGANSPHVVTNG